MYLTEILTYTDIGQLHRLAQTYQCDCNIHSRNELIQAILSSIKREQVMKEQLRKITDEERLFLIHIVFDGKNAYSLQELQARAKWVSQNPREKSEANRLIAAALRNGWILQSSRTDWQSSFNVASDLIDKWKQVLTDSLAGEVPAAPEIRQYRDDGYALARDTQYFLSFLNRQPLPLTSEGAIYRRYQQKLFSGFAVREEPLQEKGWRFGYGRCFPHYPDRFSLIYDICYEMKWIQQTSWGVLMLTDEGERRVKDIDSQKFLSQAQQVWYKMYRKPIPNLRVIVNMIVSLMNRCDWVKEDFLINRLQPVVKPFYYDDQQNILKSRILKMMVILGLLQHSVGESIYYRKSQRTLQDF